MVLAGDRQLCQVMIAVTTHRVALLPHPENPRVAALISVKKSFVASGYGSLDSANSVEFFTMIGVSVCNRPARAEKS